jgi:hypothetical protein
MLRTSIMLCVVVSACTLGPYDQQEITSTTAPIGFGGYALAPGLTVRVRVLDQASGIWDVVATATSSAVISIPPNSWGDNPALYRWSTSAPLASGCYWNPQCQRPTDGYGVATVRTRVEGSDGTNLIVFTRDWEPCMNERMAAGSTFNAAAVDCKSWSHPELRLRHVGEWLPLPVLPVTSPPGIGGMRLRLSVAVSDGVTVRVASTGTLQMVPTWQPLTGAPSAGIALDVAPVIATDPAEQVVRMIARGNDGRIYTSNLNSPLAALPIGNGATGRIALAVASPTTSHVVHASAGGLVDYWRLDGSNLATATATNHRFFGLDATVGALDANRALVAVRTATGVLLWSVTRGQSPVALGAISSTVRIEDVSEVMAYGGLYHLVVAKYDGGSSGQVVHVSTSGVLNGMVVSPIANYAPASAPAGVGLAVLHSRGERQALGGGVAIVHGHLIAAWRDATQGIQTARWDRTGSSTPWIRSATVGATLALAGRPALADVDMAEYGFEANDAGFSSDVFVASLDPARRVRFADLSRGMMRRDVERQFELFEADAVGCARTLSPAPRWLDDLARDNRPMISSLGAMLWALPPWFVDEPFLDVAKVACRGSNREPATAATGRACELERLAIQFQPTATLRVCPESLNVNHDSSVTGVWEEGGHWLAAAIGLRDDGFGAPPTQHDADVADLPLATLQQAYTLFGQPPSAACSGGLPRCPGFVQQYDSVGSRTRQHSFIYAMFGYMFFGTSLRGFIQSDHSGQPCDDLLARKYLWIRTNIFRGQEFDDRGEPTSGQSILLCQ